MQICGKEPFGIPLTYKFDGGSGVELGAPAENLPQTQTQVESSRSKEKRSPQLEKRCSSRNVLEVGLTGEILKEALTIK